VDRIEYLAGIGNIRVLEMGARGRSVDFADVRRRLGHPAREATLTKAAVMVQGSEAVTEVCSLCLHPFPSPVHLHHTEEECAALRQADAYVQKIIQTAVQCLPSILGEDTQEVEPTTPEPAPETWVAPSGLEEVIRTSCNADLAVVAVVQDDDVLDLVDGAEAVLAVLGEEKAATAPAPEVATPEIWLAPTDLDELIREGRNSDLSGVLAIFGKSGAGKNKLKLSREVTACFAADDDAVVKFKALKLLRDARKE
jgi:hypothetical protein